MFNDFNILSYWKTNHKIKKIRELINRIYGHYLFKLDKVNKIENSLNNLSTLINNIEAGITAGLLPDLTVVSITPTEYSNYFNFKIIIKNIGTADVVASVTNILMASISTNINIPALVIDETFEFNIQFAFDPLGDPKNFTITANADYNNSIEEINENNNDKSLIFTAKDEYVPPADSYVIIHCHNPEGKEINSITGVGNQAEIFIDSVSKGYGANSEGTHCIPILINPGNRLVEVKFNGITESKNINIVAGQTQQLFFIFEREIVDININGSEDNQNTWSGTLGVNTCYPPQTILKNSTMLKFAACFGYSYPPYQTYMRYICNCIASYSFNISNFNRQCEINGSINFKDGYGWVRAGAFILFHSLSSTKSIESKLFDHWFIQYNKQYGFPTIFFNNPSETFLNPSSGSDNVNIINAGVNYSNLTVDIPANSIAHTWRNHNGAISKYFSSSISMSYFKFSSVPYDMDSLAV